jgi:hypothetical protein
VASSGHCLRRVDPCRCIDCAPGRRDGGFPDAPYAQHPAVRLRQLAADVGMLAWLVIRVLLPSSR